MPIGMIANSFKRYEIELLAAGSHLRDSRNSFDSITLQMAFRAGYKSVPVSARDFDRKRAVTDRDGSK